MLLKIKSEGYGGHFSGGDWKEKNDSITTLESMNYFCRYFLDTESKRRGYGAFWEGDILRIITPPYHSFIYYGVGTLLYKCFG